MSRILTMKEVLNTLKSVKVFISSSAENLRTKLAEFCSTATVEAEFGSDIVLGSVLTLAHHDGRASRPCPCSLPNFPKLGIEAVGLSHLDLDSLGGLLAALGIKPQDTDATRDFWAAAAQVDVLGVHKLSEILAPMYHRGKIEEMLNAWWAFSENNRIFPPRDGGVEEIDLGLFVETLYHIVGFEPKELEPYEEGRFFFLTVDEDGEEDYDRCEIKFFPQREELIETGKSWAAAKAQLETESFVSLSFFGVLLRRGGCFINHLYSHGGHHGKAVVGYRTDIKSVTISLETPVEGVSCVEIAQALWGPKAGGQIGIAGSPRDREMSFEDAIAATQKLEELLSK